MPWFFPERSGPQWKQGWREQALSSLSLPPPRLVAFFLIVVFLLAVSWHRDYQTKMRRTEISLRFFLFVLPVTLVVVAPCFFADGWFVFRPRAPHHQQQQGASPWGVLALVVLLLLMVSYQSSFQSQWFRPVWRTD